MKHRRNISGHKGFTIVELIVTVTIIAILASVTTGLIAYFMQVVMYAPREMKAKTIAQEIAESIIEGQTLKRGTRYASEIQDASATRFTYIFGYPGNTDKRSMRFRWDSAAKKIYCSYTAFGDATSGPQPPYGQEEAVPYYTRGEISVTGRTANPSTVFTYFKQDGSVWVNGIDPLTAIRRVEINIAVSTGSGLFQGGEGSFETTSGVEVKQYI